MKNICLLVHCILSFEVPSYNKIQDRASQPVPLFLVVLHHISFYISKYHFYYFLERNPRFSEKKIFATNFLLNRFTQATKPLNSQNLLSMTKVFVKAP